MSRIYKTNSRIEVKVDDLSVFISPLSYHQKMSLQVLMLKAANNDMNAAMEAVVCALKMSIKDIKGLQVDDEGTEYQLEFSGDEVSDECINDLLNLPCSNKLSAICTSLLAGVPDKILGPDGMPIEGISFVKPKMEKSKPKK